MRTWLHNAKPWSDDPLADSTVVVVNVDEYLRTIEEGPYPEPKVQVRLRRFWLSELESSQPTLF